MTITSRDNETLVVLSTKLPSPGPNECSTFTEEVERVAYRVRRPRGKKVGLVIGYENGTFSSVSGGEVMMLLAPAIGLVQGMSFTSILKMIESFIVAMVIIIPWYLSGGSINERVIF